MTELLVTPPYRSTGPTQTFLTLVSVVLGALLVACEHRTAAPLVIARGGDRGSRVLVGCVSGEAEEELLHLLGGHWLGLAVLGGAEALAHAGSE
jgi:hypothetical protein